MKSIRSLKIIALGAAAGFAVAAAPTGAAAQEQYIGELRTFGFSFCPQGWARTEGQLLPIAQNSALFSLLGTTFGGDGRTNFQLPDLQGRVVIGSGMGPGLSNYSWGQKGGSEQSTLSVAEMPSHAHGVSGLPSGETAFVKEDKEDKGLEVVKAGAAGSTSTQNAGGGQSHDNRQPYLAMTTCIALVGIFPSRP